MKPLTLLPVLLHGAFASNAQKLLLSEDNIDAYIASVTPNSNRIFNAIYSSMRQWGSSIQHNGMSIFPAYIPEGTLLYHGSPVAKQPDHVEWLAFEIPHAEMFSSRVKIRGSNPDYADLKAIGGFVDLRSISLEQRLNLKEPDFEIEPGYLQIYQAERPLKVLYLDGMSAAKSDRGTLDLQDILLLNFTRGMFAERERAAALCDFGKEIGVEGFVRMECGFELIMCDFSDGLVGISFNKRPDNKAVQRLQSNFLFEFVRDIGSRYHGIDAGRVLLDYSSMISAFFYPANLANSDPDPRQSKLPRLVEASGAVLKEVRSHVQSAVKDSKGPGIDWQGVTDMIVKRFAPRLSLLATGLPHEQFLSEVSLIMNTFIDYGVPVKEQDPAEACSMHYLHPTRPSSNSDLLIALAFKTLTHKICDTLWDIRTTLLEKEEEIDTMELIDVSEEVDKIQKLMNWLDWSDWTSCGECAVDEVCFISIFPWGTEEEHYHPRCLNREELGPDRREKEGNYWRLRQRKPEDASP